MGVAVSWLFARTGHPLQISKQRRCTSVIFLASNSTQVSWDLKPWSGRQQTQRGLLAADTVFLFLPAQRLDSSFIRNRSEMSSTAARELRHKPKEILRDVNFWFSFYPAPPLRTQLRYTREVCAVMNLDGNIFKIHFNPQGAIFFFPNAFNALLCTDSRARLTFERARSRVCSFRATCWSCFYSVMICLSSTLLMPWCPKK